MRENEEDTMTSALPASATKVHLATYDLASARPWPFKAEDGSPLAWWRMLPSQAFGEPDRLHLRATLEQLNVLHAEHDLMVALKGDAAAAIEVTFTLMPMSEISLKTDIAMTALLRCAREGNAAACLVLAQVLGLTDLDHPYARELANSWLSYGQLCSENPREFSNAVDVLLTAFHERPQEQDA
ncbi:hypothetical protein [Bradyrhizobium japonicum]|uniref:hypothetical protein n=1 Tax=Bradyrhizobium japonicum TaxID=375 RepID=UPI0027151B16|nr:hypothetical protein [Bradyrhizobium japonicum]WLB23884.1 hypothetical protein QIH95_48840 [Bradyrhizobium japonicum]